MCWFQGGDTRPQVSAWSCATVSNRWLDTSILIDWLRTLMVCRHTQAVHPKDVHELWVAIFRRFWTQLVEQAPHWTAIDQQCYCFSPETENTLVQSVVAATHICGFAHYKCTYNIIIQQTPTRLIPVAIVHSNFLHSKICPRQQTGSSSTEFSLMVTICCMLSSTLASQICTMWTRPHNRQLSQKWHRDCVLSQKE